MLIGIASCLGSPHSISCLARTNLRAYEVLERYLYRFDVETAKFCPKAFRFTCLPARGDLAIDGITKKSLDAGADINTLITGSVYPGEEMLFALTAMCMAALFKNLLRAQKLIDAGASVNSTCTSGKSVLVYAVESRSLELVRLLIEQPGIQLKHARIVPVSPLVTLEALSTFPKYSCRWSTQTKSTKLYQRR